MKRLLIFDFDGVLADSLDHMLRFAGQVCRELGVMVTPTKADLEALEKMEFSEFGRQLGIPDDQLERFVERNHELFSNNEESVQMVPGMKAVVSALAEDNILAIITGNSCNLVEKFLLDYKLREKFQAILCAEHEGSRLEKILRVKKSFNMQNNSAYMIGDAVSDIRAAKAAGIHSVAVTWGHQSKGKLSQASPDLIIEEPTDFLRRFSEE